jgi:methylenetetrahydrofolate dehydrogenase (NADP+)/methenyltetrahydrofolate cyclohydrolase
VVEILDYYGFGDVTGKTISIIWQSNLVGKPLAVALMNRGATVGSFNIDSDSLLVASRCEQSDIIISATGKVHLIDQWYFWERIDLSQKVMIDVGRGSFEWKPAGDINWRYYEQKVQAITPVPWGVGPVTVACLFANIVKLGG